MPDAAADRRDFEEKLSQAMVEAFPTLPLCDRCGTHEGQPAKGTLVNSVVAVLCVPCSNALSGFLQASGDFAMMRVIERKMDVLATTKAGSRSYHATMSCVEDFAKEKLRLEGVLRGKVLAFIKAGKKEGE
jgi:hypothetical protein